MSTTLADAVADKLEQETQPEDLSDVLAKSIRFVMLRKGGLPGYYKLTEAKVTLSDKELDKERFVGGSLRAIPRQWSSKFTSVYGKAESLIRAAAPDKSDVMPPMIPGIDVVAAERVETLKAQVAKVEAEDFKPLLDSFLEAYPGILQDIEAEVKEANPAAWARLATRLPKAADIKASARLQLDEIPISFVGDAGKKAAENIALQIVHGLSEKLEEEVDRVQKRIVEDGVFKAGTFTELKRQFSLLREFDFLASPELKQKLTTAESTFNALGNNPHLALNENMKSSTKDIVTGLSGVLSGLVVEAKKDAKEASGRFRRAIELD